MYFITRKDYKRNGSFVRVCGVFLPYCNNVMRKKTYIYRAVESYDGIGETGEETAGEIEPQKSHYIITL